MPRVEIGRREWCQLVTAGAAALASGCTDEPDVACAVLEPSSEGFIVAVWADAADGAGTVLVETRTAGRVVRVDELDLAASNTAVLELLGLSHDTAYEITCSTTARSRTYRARTAPSADEQRPVRIAVSADFDPAAEHATDVIPRLLEHGPELFVSLGDFPYTDNGPPAQTLSEYRSRHVETRRASTARQLFEAVGVRAIYDDHEFRNDWDASWVEAERARYDAAMTAWDEFFPVADRDGSMRYRSWRWGAHLECVLLDVRRHRSANAAPDGPDKRMLGPDQLAWALARIRDSSATFKLVLTGVPLDFANGSDAWHAFATERTALLDGVLDVPGVLFVSADQHYFASHRHAHGIREIQVGPLARGVLPFGPDGAGVLFRAGRMNAGLFEASRDQLVVRGVGVGGEVFYEETLTPDTLTPRRA